jgi:hypothetical protein
MKKQPPTKRNPVAKSAPRATSGGGAHKDKKAANKRGEPPKHKKPKEEYMKGLNKELQKFLKEEHDYEGAMARQQLIIMATQAITIARNLKDYTQLDAWVQTKISVASDDIRSVHDFLIYQKQDVTGEYLSNEN